MRASLLLKTQHPYLQNDKGRIISLRYRYVKWGSHKSLRSLRVAGIVSPKNRSNRLWNRADVELVDPSETGTVEQLGVGAGTKKQVQNGP